MRPRRSAIALRHLVGKRTRAPSAQRPSIIRAAMAVSRTRRTSLHHIGPSTTHNGSGVQVKRARFGIVAAAAEIGRSEEHTSELQSLMRISYAVFCLKKKNQDKTAEDRQTI